MQKHLLGYRDNLRVEVEPGIRLSQGLWLNFARFPLGQAHAGKGSAMICQCDTPRCGLASKFVKDRREK